MKRLAFASLLFLATPAGADPLLVHNGRLFISATIAGVSTEALLDSGAEATLIDPALAKRAGLPEGQAITIKGSGGGAPARIVPGVTVEALGVTLHPEAVVVLDLSDLSTRLIKRPTQAIVGRELFDAARLRIDLRGGTIGHADANTAPPGKRLTLTAHAGIEAIPVTVNGVETSAEFDLGNGSDVMISRAIAETLGLKITGRKAGGGIGGEIERDSDRLVEGELVVEQAADVVCVGGGVHPCALDLENEAARVAREPFDGGASHVGQARHRGDERGLGAVVEVEGHEALGEHAEQRALGWGGAQCGEITRDVVACGAELG